MQQATVLLEQGRLADARTLYARITQANPNDAEAWLMLAAINGELGALDDAIECCRRAVSSERDNVDAHVVLGRLLTAGGELDEAAASFTEALTHDPEYGEVWNMLAGIYGQRGVYDEAERCSREAIRVLPDQADGYINLTNALLALGRAADAAQAGARAVTLDPANALSWNMLGLAREGMESWAEAEQSYMKAIAINPSLTAAQTGLGRILQAKGDLAGAERVLRQVLQLNPLDCGAFCNLGSLYVQQQLFDKAESCLRQAVQITPAFAEAWIDLGNLMQNQDRPDEAMSCYQQALAHAPKNPDAHFNQGVLYQRQGKLESALASFDQAIAYRPDFVDAHWYKSFIYLLQGNYDRGWEEYEWRLRQKKNIPRPFHQPVWDGSPLDGRTILVHDEQGYGDTFQFVRYLRQVKARGGRVVFECHPQLAAVLRGCDGYDELVERTSLREVPATSFDVQIHLMSLPGVLKTRLDNVPCDLPYIKADPMRAERWRMRIAEDKGYKVGIAWAGSPHHTNELNRSCALAEFAPLGDIAGISLYSLQKGPGSEQADTAPTGIKLVRVDKELDKDIRFVDTAALMENLDLIISIDTSIAHLAGAMGRPVWTLLCATPDWRWMLERTDSSWYPSMRLFRQAQSGDWGNVFTQVSKALAITTRQWKR